MTAHILPAFGELRSYYRSAAVAADARGDAPALKRCRAAAADLMEQVKPPKLQPHDLDEALEWRAFADAMAGYAYHRTRHSYDVVSRQGCYAQRLDAIVTQWGAE